MIKSRRLWREELLQVWCTPQSVRLFVFLENVFEYWWSRIVIGNEHGFRLTWAGPSLLKPAVRACRWGYRPK